MSDTKILLIAPLVDIPTFTSNKAVFHILEYAGKYPDIDMDLMWWLGANRLSFNWKVSIKKYDLIIYYGHGKTYKLYGNHIFLSMINMGNIHRIGGTPMDTMACLSAKGLGFEAVKRGSKAYIGTIKPYYAAFPEIERDYLEDWIDYTTIKTKRLIDGATFGEAYNAFIKKCEYYLDIYEIHLDEYNYSWYYKTLKENMKNTILIGDKNTRIR